MSESREQVAARELARKIVNSVDDCGFDFLSDPWQAEIIAVVVRALAACALSARLDEQRNHHCMFTASLRKRIAELELLLERAAEGRA